MDSFQNTLQSQAEQIDPEMIDPEIRSDYPIDRYIELIDRSQDFGNYRLKFPAVSSWCHGIRSRWGDEALEQYHKLVVLSLCTKFERRAEDARLPESIRELSLRFLQRLVADFSKKKPGYFCLENDQFCKDLGVARQKLLPCGSQLVDVKSGIPRRTIFTGNLSQGLTLPWFVTTKLGGYRPLFEMHMDPRLILEFSPSGWRRCYSRIAELLLTRPEIRGVCGSSWWFDPAAAEVSPRLGFLRELPLSAGARFFCVGPDDQNTQDALMNSKQRRDHFERGEYKPRRYLLIWPRDALIRWSREQEREL